MFAKQRCALILNTMSEVNCSECSAACCKGSTTIELSASEYEQMSQAGTDFLVVAEPVDFDRDNIVYPSGNFEINEKSQVAINLEEVTRVEPLAADLGWYVMLGECANLRRFMGREIRGIYPTRPDACRAFQVGEFTCLLLRNQAGISGQATGN